MDACYWMGCNVGKKRSDGSPFFTLNVLSVNRWGALAIIPIYVDERTYNEYLEKDWVPGVSVTVNTTFAGVFQSIVLDSRYCDLELDKRSENNGIKPKG